MGLPSLSNLRQYRKQGRRRKSKEEKRKRCVRYTLLIANSLLALLGLLLLAGGAWRTQSRRPPLTSTSTMPFWPWAESPSLQLSLAIVEPKKRTSASSPSTVSASSSSSSSRSPLSSSSTLTTPTSTSSRTLSAKRLARLTLRSCSQGPSLSRTCSLECPLAFPQSSSSSQSPSAVGRGGRRESKDMLMPSRLKKIKISTVFS